MQHKGTCDTFALFHYVSEVLDANTRKLKELSCPKSADEQRTTRRMISKSCSGCCCRRWQGMRWHSWLCAQLLSSTVYHPSPSPISLTSTLTSFIVGQSPHLYCSSVQRQGIYLFTRLLSAST